MTVLAAHQPNFLPWLGFFHKMSHADVWVHMDDAQIPRGRSFANRARLRDGIIATVPLGRRRCEDHVRTYNNTWIAGDARWASKLLRTLRERYARAPWQYPLRIFDLIFPRWAMGPVDVLNRALIEEYAAYMEVQPRFERASRLKSGDTISKRIVGWCRAFECDVYLSGPSGPRYLDMDVFAEANITVKVDSFDASMNYSVIHYLMEQGPDAMRRVHPGPTGKRE